MSVPVGLTFKVLSKAEPYRKALRAAGLDPVDISSDTPRASLHGLCGLVLSGGGDIEPSRYGEDNESSSGADPRRDDLELRLVREALDVGMPVFAICRGMQLLNVALGGTLVQDIGDRHSNAQHGVTIEPGSLLSSIVGYACQVNSRHHQAVRRLGRGLLVSAKSPDGIIEAVDMPSKEFVLAVQWHPEDLAIEDPPSTPHLRLFEAFRDAVINWKR